MSLCVTCSLPCEKIGTHNRIGFRKEFCCRCFAKIDPKYTKNLWCKFCKEDNKR